MSLAEAKRTQYTRIWADGQTHTKEEYARTHKHARNVRKRHEIHVNLERVGERDVRLKKQRELKERDRTRTKQEVQVTSYGSHHHMDYWFCKRHRAS